MNYQLTSLRLLLLLVGFSILFCTCKKDDTLADLALASGDPQVATSVRFETDPVDQEKRTILGVVRNNPFALANIHQAQTKLYGAGAAPKLATHRYVKFMPTHPDHLMLLEDWEIAEEVALFDVPLAYEVVQQGEHYIDPAVADSLFTYRYAVIPVNVTLPQVPHVLLEDLHLDRSDPLLLAESFRLTGNVEEVNSYVFNGGLGKTQTDTYAGIVPPGTIPEQPDEPCPFGYVWELVIVENPAPGEAGFKWECHLLGPPPPPPEPKKNPCGCLVSKKERQPAGCVRVQDGFDMVPVQGALVKVRDNWFTAHLTYTTEEGCWHVNDNYSGKVRMWVSFKNLLVKAKDVNFWWTMFTVKDYVGKFTGPPYNNITVDYSNDLADNTSKAKKYWAAAHTLNTVINYRRAAIADNIPLPRLGLNWINKRGSGAAGAPMLKGQAYNSWLGLYVVYNLEALAPIYFAALTQLPDIVNQYGKEETAGEFNGTGFHELGHASHYKLVGEQYWLSYRNHIINNNGYGSFGNFNGVCCPKLVALGEAVGNYVGAKYGETTDGGEINEWDDDDNFIPQGLLWDLEDDNVDVVEDPNDPTITGLDLVSGFTPQMMFEGLTPNVYSVRAFRDRLRILHLDNTSNTVTDYNNLVDIYDVFN